MLGMNNTIDCSHKIKEVNSKESTQAELFQTSKPTKHLLQIPNLTTNSTLSSKGSFTMRKSDLHSALKSPALNQPLHESKNSFDFHTHKTIDTSKTRQRPINLAVTESIPENTGSFHSPCRSTENGRSRAHPVSPLASSHDFYERNEPESKVQELSGQYGNLHQQFLNK